MVRITKMTAEQAADEIKKHPTREIGKWTKICEEVRKSGQAVKLESITRGQAWSVKRKAKEVGILAVVTKDGDVVLSRKPTER